MNECVRRWKENQPLTATEIVQMRLQAGLRIFLMLALLAFVLFALCGCRSVQAYQLEPVGKFPVMEVPESEQTFDGVTIVVAVKGLTEFAPELRRKAAYEADRVLSQIAERKLNGKVRTRLIAEVAEPQTFQNFQAVSGQNANPVLVHVLVPIHNNRITIGLILKKVQEMAQAHFLEDLQKHQLLVTFQRQNPERYQLGMMGANLREPPVVELPRPSVPEADVPQAPEPEKKSRDGLVLTMLVAWLTERSKLAAKLLAMYQRFGSDVA